MKKAFFPGPKLLQDLISSGKGNSSCPAPSKLLILPKGREIPYQQASGLQENRFKLRNQGGEWGK